jgi:hypothetical protein
MYSNNARTTLAGNISNSDTALPVANSIGFPLPFTTGDHFFITIDDGVNVEIVKVLNVSGNNFINCVRGQEGTVAHAFTSGTSVENRLTAGNITNMATLDSRLATVSSLDLIDSPANSSGNSILCSSTDVTNTPIIAVVNGTKWRLLNYPDVVKSGVSNLTNTTTSINITGIGNSLIDTVSKTYIIQFTSGSNIGKLRFISSVTTNQVTWVAALDSIPAAIDTYEIYRCISSWKNATGGNNDRIFFENDAQIWSDYTIPTGRNASSTGPVLINSGVTVVVPAGSSWTIV